MVLTLRLSCPEFRQHFSAEPAKSPYRSRKAVSEGEREQHNLWFRYNDHQNHDNQDEGHEWLA
jgi:hypothetical protein